MSIGDALVSLLSACLLPCLLACCVCTAGDTSEVTVTCTKPTGSAGWPDSFDVTLSVNQTKGVCDASGSDKTTVTVTKKPVLTVKAPEASTICSDATQQVLKFNVSSTANGSVTLSVDSPGVPCSPPSTPLSLTGKFLNSAKHGSTKLGGSHPCRVGCTREQKHNASLRSRPTTCLLAMLWSHY